MAKSPAYYTRGSIECWDFIRDQALNYHLGCAVKYICRAGHKDSKEADLKKAIHYLQNELDNILLDSTNIDGSGGGIPNSLLSYDTWEDWEWEWKDDSEIIN
ncbi:MAG: hypothetical protein CBC48_15505 [bacterium TMED88]|nr:MAG: hypothetical protein CBC48_15505 [bacterium TMED88]